MGLAGFAWGASEAARDLRGERAREAEQAARAQREAAEHGLRLKALMAELAQGEANEKRAARDQQLQEAAIALQQADGMGQGAELSPDVASLLTGTPYGARVEQKATLPSRTMAMPIEPFKHDSVLTTPQSDPGGRAYATLRPTEAQLRDQAQRSAMEAAVNNPSLPPLVRRLIDLRRIGVSIPNPESLETPEERDQRAQTTSDANFRDFKRRTDYQASVTEGARRRAAQDAARIRPRDRLDAYRLADAAAADYLLSLKDESGFFPADQTVDPEAIRQQFLEQYLRALDPSAPAPASTRKIIEGLRPVTGLMPSHPTARTLVPLQRSAGSSRPAASDPYEQYLARTRR